MKIRDVKSNSHLCIRVACAACAAAPITATTDGMMGFMGKSNMLNTPTIPSEMIKAVRSEPNITLPDFDLTGIFSTSLSIIILELLFHLK